MKPVTSIWRQLTAGAIALVVIGAVAFVSLRSGPLAPIRVTVTQAHEGSLLPEIFGIGSVEAQRSWMIGPTLAARVRSVRVDVGDPVKAGQLLAEMDPVDLDQRVAALDASLARAASTRAGAQAQLRDAAARSALASANNARYQDLARQDFISAGALDARVQEQASAQAALQAAQANLSASAHDLTRLQAERDGLAQQRSSLRLLAPADAVVTTRDAEAGSTVVAGQPVLRLADPKSLWIRLRVDQGRSNGLRAGLQGRIVLRSQAPTVLPGQVARVELLADSVTEERIAQIAFIDPPKGVSIGEMAEVTLQMPATAPALLLPNASIQRHGELTGVWRIRDQLPEFAPVEVGLSSLDGQVQILKGLEKQDQVVVYSEKALTAGARIRVVDTLLQTGARP